MKFIIMLSMTTLLFFNCGPPKIFTNSLGMVFIYIEPGTFTMGDDNGKDNEKPAHQVTISKGFYMQNTEVTVSQFSKFVQET
jgi:formylglycine-generating enzyme required for sulfatase activity